MNKIKTAVDTFDSNFNCAQAVFSAFSEELGLEKNISLKIASCFGGGMRCGEVCGAVSGALMTIGLKYGQYLSDDLKTKNDANSKAYDFIAKFKEKNQSIICRDLLGHDMSLPDDVQKIKEQNLFNTVCPKMITDAVEITEGIINSENAD